MGKKKWAWATIDWILHFRFKFHPSTLVPRSDDGAIRMERRQRSARWVGFFFCYGCTTCWDIPVTQRRREMSSRSPKRIYDMYRQSFICIWLETGVHVGYDYSVYYAKIDLWYAV